MATDKKDPIKINENAHHLVLVSLIIQNLNEMTGRNFTADSQTNIELIAMWISRGYQLDDFIRVIDFKAMSWLHIAEMKPYLKPLTLFAPHNFKQYLEEANKFFDSS